jgi:hypothetical protein
MLSIIFGTLAVGYASAVAYCSESEIRNRLCEEEWEMAMFKVAIYKAQGYQTVMKSEGRATCYL